MSPRAWLLYDGTCGLCSHAAPRLGRIVQARGIVTLPAQTPWVQQRLMELGCPDAAADDILLFTAEGQLLRGPAAYRHCLRQVWWTWPAWALAGVPGLRQLFDMSYRAIARRRHRLSRACGLRPTVTGRPSPR